MGMPKHLLCVLAVHGRVPCIHGLQLPQPPRVAVLRAAELRDVLPQGAV